MAVRVRDAQGAGLSRGVLRGVGWTPLTHGLYVPTEALPLSMPERCAALRQALPGEAVFIELTAALLHGWWMPPLPLGLPVAVSVPEDVRLSRRDLRTRRLTLLAHQVGVAAGMPVTTPARTLADLADSLCLIDLVVLGDSALHLGTCSKSDLEATTPRRGRSLHRRAVELMDERAESPYETLLRLLHVLGGFVHVEPQFDLVDPHGDFIGRADLWLRDTRRVHEVDGGTHRDPHRHAHDLARDKRMLRAGYERYGYTTREVLWQPGRILRDAEAAYGLPHDPGRMSSWLDAIQASLFTPAGRRRLAARWRIDAEPSTGT